MDVGFKNATVASFADARKNHPLKSTRGPPGYPILGIIYAGTTSGSPLRRLVVDMWVHSTGMNYIKHLSETLPHDFVLEFSRALLMEKCEPMKDTISRRERVTDYYK
jgi:hypothetical protein